MSEIQIKSELLKNEIIQFSNMLKDGNDIYPVFRQMFFSMRKLDHLHENKLKVLDEIVLPKQINENPLFKDEFLKELIRISAPDSKEDCEGERLVNCIGRKVLSYVEKNR